jgi:pilus assembly protein Flp/PilA
VELSRNVKSRNAAALGHQRNFTNQRRPRVARESPQLNQFLEVRRQLRYAIATSVSGNKDATMGKERKGFGLTDILPVKNSEGNRVLLMTLIMRFWKDEDAATAIEYGLIAAGIAVAIIPVITGLGTKLKTTFSTIQSALK